MEFLEVLCFENRAGSMECPLEVGITAIRILRWVAVQLVNVVGSNGKDAHYKRRWLRGSH